MADTKRVSWLLVWLTARHSAPTAASDSSAQSSLVARWPGIGRNQASAINAASSSSICPASRATKGALEAMLLHPPIERAAGQPQLGRRGGDVVAMLVERALDQLPLGAVEIEVGGHLLDHGGGLHARRGYHLGQRKILERQRRAVGEDNRSLRSMAERADIARPVIGDQRGTYLVGQYRRGPL